MSNEAFPSSLTPSSTTWSFVSNTRAYRSPLTNAVQTVARAGSLWRVTMQFNNLNDDDRATLQAYLLSMDGQVNRMKLADHSYTRRGAGGGTPLVNNTSGSQTGGTLILDGAAADVTGWLKAGDYFRVGNELKMVTADCNSVDDDVTVHFKPNLRSSPANNDPIYINTGTDLTTNVVYGVFFLASDPKWDNRPGIFSSFSLEAFEDVLA